MNTAVMLYRMFQRKARNEIHQHPNAAAQSLSLCQRQAALMLTGGAGSSPGRTEQPTGNIKNKRGKKKRLYSGARVVDVRNTFTV